MFRSSISRRGFLGALLVLAGTGAPGSSVIAPTFARLVAAADWIVTGQVLHSRCEWQETSGRRRIVTLVTVGIESTLKGAPQRTVTLQFLGGTIGEVSLEIAEMPRLQPGDRAILFIEGNGRNASALVGLYHGRFPLRRDADGRERVRHPDGRALGSVAEIGRPAARAAGPAMTREEFAAAIHRALEEGARP